MAGAFRDLAKIARFKELNAQKDSLTGLFNLGFYNEMLAGQIKLIENMENPGKRTHARSTRGVAVLRIDMDRFKAINDTYGHRAGDEALKLAARIMIDALREDDVIARTGGDEFTILLKNIKKPDADALMKKLQSRFDVASFEFDDGRQKHIIDVNASVGITMIEAGQNAAEIFDNVDNDMMARKAGRKEKILLYDMCARSFY